MIDDRHKQQFAGTVWAYYEAHGRHDLPWRQPEPDGRFDPYKILVSELMLQQTQVGRVIPKYHELLYRFPVLSDLAAAPSGAVLSAWSGLGYNRRAKFLWQAAQQVMERYGGVFPQDGVQLKQLPGIGPNTAGAILAYAFNQPVVFIETNIRTVYLHHFFADQSAVLDKAILDLVARTLDRDRPREWYWALMDYGSHLKRTIGNLNRQSSGYTKQSAFHGSNRQLRGQVIRLLAAAPHSGTDLRRLLPDERLEPVLIELQKEGLIQRQGDHYHL